MSVVSIDLLDELKGRLASYLTVYTDSDLYANFRFDGDTTNLLDPNNTRASFSGSAPTYITGKYNSAAQINSTTRSISSSMGDGVRSFNAWVSFNSTASGQVGRILTIRSSTDTTASEAGFYQNGQTLHAINNATTSSAIYTISAANTFYLLSGVLANDPSFYLYVGSSSVYTASTPSSLGTFLKLSSAGDTIGVDNAMTWNRALSSDEISWLSRGWTAYVAEETDTTGLQAPAVQILPAPDGGPNYWMGTNVEKTRRYSLEVAFKYGDHSRVLDGVSYSNRSLVDYYTEILEKALNQMSITTSGYNETSRDVSVQRYVEKADFGYLGGCLGRLETSHRVDWSA